MRKKSESGRWKTKPVDPTVTKTGVYAADGPKRQKGIGMIGMGLGSEERGIRDQMPEHAVKASQKRASKKTHRQDLASSGFARRAADSRKKRDKDQA